SKITRPCYLCPCGPKSSEPLVELGNSLLPLSLHGQRPTSHGHANRQELWKPLLAGERHTCLCPLLGGVSLPTGVMQHGRIVEGSRQAEGVRQVLGQGDRLVAPCEGLVWIAELPEGPGAIGEAPHPQVHAIAEGQMMVLLAIIERYPLLQVRSTRGQLSKVVFCSPQRIIGHQQERWVVSALGQAEALLGQLSRRLGL